METLFEVQDNTIDIDTEMLVLDNEPFNPYTQANYDPPEKEYSLDADGHFIIYDIDEEETPYSSNRTTFVHTESDESKLWLAQPANKVKKTWYNQIVKTELNVDPKFATDNACYEMESILPNIASNVIQATYLGPMKDIPSKPTFHITPGSLVQAQLPSGLKVTVLIDTGCHKTILNRKFLQKNLFHFKNFKKVPLREDHKIKLANGLIIKTDGLIAMPLIIQDYLFQFLALVTTLSEDFDFVLGLESLIQLESVYSLGQNILQMENRCIPLYPVKDVILPPKAQIGIVITGELPRTFSSGFAVVHVIPVTNTYSVVTTETEFINQTTCFNLTNTINKSRYFYHNIPFGYLDTRSIGYYEPLTATQMISSDHLIFPSHMASISEHSIDRLIHEEPALDNQDPYPWLDPQDPRRFQTDRELLEQLIDLSDSCLTPLEKEQFYDLLEQYKKAFSLRDEIGLAHGMQITLELTDTTPFFIRPFSAKEDMKGKIDKEMNKLCILGILRKELSGYSSPAMAIPRKKSDIPRVVADFRYLNTILPQLNMSFPLVRECIQSIGASQCEVMSVIDLRDAYHTLRLTPNSQQYCGITPYYGSDTYLYQRLPMGLKVSPAIWQAFINKVLGPIPNRQRHIAIMDDCLVHSKFADHMQDLINLFQSLMDHGLKMSPKKCQFFRTSLIYMGFKFLIDKGRPSFTPMKDKCDSIRNLEPPKTVKDCRKFCGMVNFLATFLKGLQKHLVPIYNLTKKNTTFKWTSECQKSFDTIKNMLTQPPILRMPDTKGIFRLMSDTSILATGAALYQFQDNNYYIVGYNSKKLPEAAKNYSITELELFGLVINIHAFRQLLSHVYFECFCDHSAITYILTSKKKIATRRIQKLIEQLMQFNFSIYYLPGSKMHIADMLSRLAGKDLDPPDKVIPISFNAMQSSQPRRCSPRIKKQAIQTPYPAGKIDRILSSYQPQVLLKRLPEILNKDTHISKIDTYLKADQPKPKDIVPKPKIIYQSNSCNNNSFPSMQSPTGRLKQKKLSHSILPQDKLTLINPTIQIPNTLPPIEVPPPQTQNIETYRSPENFLYNKPLPVLKDSKELNVFSRHIPKQTEIDEFLAVLKAKVTKEYKLPLLAQSIINAYPQSPAFRNIYQYITTNTLPPNRRLQRSIISNSDNYIVADGLLFKLQQVSRNKQMVHRCLLVIPEAFEHVVFHMYHDSLLGAHYGPLNTYYTIKDKYHIHNLLDKINKYVASCEECQKQKVKTKKSRYFHPRIPLDYNPLAYISADIKYMPKGIYNYEFLLVIVCEVTGFVIAIPMVKHDAVTIAHALLEKLIFIFGPPKTLIVDEDRALSAKVMHYILDALKVNIKLVSPSNHGSLKTERYIQTINNLITRQLTGKGREWPLYVMSTCYAMNTFVSPSTGFSPYELVFLRKPPDILNLYFEPLQTIAKGYEDYCLKMKHRLEHVGNVILELKTFQQERQAQLAHNLPTPPETFQEGQLVYLLAPSAATLRTKTMKCRADFVGPLVVNKALDPTHYILNDLQGRVLIGVFHINRLKKATVRTPSGAVSTYQQLHDSFTHITQQEANAATPAPDIAPAAALQSTYPLSYRHNTGCGFPDSPCECILDTIPFN